MGTIGATANLPHSRSACYKMPIPVTGAIRVNVLESDDFRSHSLTAKCLLG